MESILITILKLVLVFGILCGAGWCAWWLISRVSNEIVRLVLTVMAVVVGLVALYQVVVIYTPLLK